MQLCKKIYILKPKSYYMSVTKLYRNSVQPWFPSLCKPALWRGENVSRAVRHRHRQQQLHQDEINRVETTGWAFTAAEMEKQHENIYIKPDFKSTPEPCLSVDIKTDSSRELLKTSRLPLSLFFFTEPIVFESYYQGVRMRNSNDLRNSNSSEGEDMTAKFELNNRRESRIDGAR